MLIPSRDEYIALAAEYDVVPVALEAYADLSTPISAFMSLAQDEPYAFLLESVVGGEQLGRYSFLGIGDTRVVSARDGVVTVSGSDGSKSEPVTDPLEVVSRELGSGAVAQIPGLPRLVGGFVGYVGYEAAADFERMPRHDVDEQDLPDLAFMSGEVVVAFDHARRMMLFIAPTRPGTQPEAAYDRAVEAISRTAERLGRSVAAGGFGFREMGAHVPLEPRTSREDFLASVRRAKEHIDAGDVFQVVLSQRFEAPYDGDGLDLYRVLRTVNPSPYMFYVRTPEVTLVGSSPEPLVRVEGDEVLTRPLAGTRPRGVDISEDARLREDLLADDKECAEHVMLVDLGRNDLGRVSVPGSVSVSQLMEVEDYSHVMHIVSTVRGEMQEGKDAFDALRATFPAGTVSGAPKIRAMEIIRDLEPVARGPYAGTVGYVGLDGAMDMCITIRTIVVAGGKAVIQSGAGIVADSDPEREYEETLHKARAMHRTLELAAGMNDARPDDPASHSMEAAS